MALLGVLVAGATVAVALISPSTADSIVKIPFWWAPYAVLGVVAFAQSVKEPDTLTRRSQRQRRRSGSSD